MNKTNLPKWKPKPQKYDLGCKHGNRYRVKEGKDSACALCVIDRLRKRNARQDEIIAKYVKLYPMMDLDAKPGTKVRFWFPHYGWDGDQRRTEEKGLKLGEIYTVHVVRVGESNSDVELREVPGVKFNTVHFAAVPDEEEETAGEMIAKEERYAALAGWHAENLGGPTAP